MLESLQSSTFGNRFRYRQPTLLDTFHSGAPGSWNDGNRCEALMISLPLRAEYLEMGKSFVDNERNIHSEAFEVVYEDLHDDVFFNLFWVVHFAIIGWY